MKNNKGISLMSLVITIILILIITSISIYYGVSKNIDIATDTISYNEILDVSEAVSQRALLNKLNASLYPLIGTPLSDSNPIKIQNISYGDNWYRLEDGNFSDLSLESVKNVYIVNYETSEVVSISPIVYNGKTYYDSEEVRSAITGNTTSKLSNTYDAVKGVNKPILISGMIPVKNLNGSWVITNSEDSEWYDYSSQNKIWANVMLMDDITILGYTNSEIRSVSLSELEGKVVTNNGSMLVWIPRYSTNSAGEIIYSNVLNDYTKDGFTVPDSFKNNTGIWMSKYDVEYK